MDLLKIYEKNKELEKKQNDLRSKEEIKDIVCSIIKGDETYKVNNKTKKILKEIGIKAYNRNFQGLFGMINEEYIKLNKTNIQKIQKYIDKENANG